MNTSRLEELKKELVSIAKKVKKLRAGNPVDRTELSKQLKRQYAVDQEVKRLERQNWDNDHNYIDWDDER